MAVYRESCIAIWGDYSEIPQLQELEDKLDASISYYSDKEIVRIVSEKSSYYSFANFLNSESFSEKLLKLNRGLGLYQSLYRIGWNAKWFNHPVNGRTLIQKMIREGDFEFLQQISPHIPLEQVRLSPHFTQDEFRECLAIPPSVPISKMSVEPVLVAQQGCTSIVRLKDGSNLRLPATKAFELRKKILKEHRVNPESRKTDHVFTIYLNRNHASYSLEKSGSSRNNKVEHYGLYPSSDPLTPISTVPCAVVDDRINSLDSERTNELMLRIPITDTQRNSLLQYKKERESNCIQRRDYYLPLGRNCVDFVQENYEAAGLPGHFGDLIDPHKMVNKFKRGQRRHTLAMQYTFVRVMGLTAFFLAQFTAFDFSDDYATRKILYAADLLVAGLMLYLMYKCVQKGAACCSRVFRRQQS